MSEQEFEGQWKKLKGKVKQRWGKLTDDDVERITGKKDELVGALQKRYGESKEWAEDQIDKWQKELGS